MNQRFRTAILCLGLGFCLGLGPSVFAGPGDYSLRAKVGPSFEINDWHDQIRLGAEFDYDLGYGLGVGLMGIFGVSTDFRFQLIPSFRYNVLYIGPASVYGAFGVGYGRFNGDDSLDCRMALGMTLPLGEAFEVNSDANFFVSPVGTPGTPITLDWLISFGMKFH